MPASSRRRSSGCRPNTCRGASIIRNSATWGTSIIRNTPLRGPYSGNMPRIERLPPKHLRHEQEIQSQQYIHQKSTIDGKATNKRFKVVRRERRWKNELGARQTESYTLDIGGRRILPEPLHESSIYVHIYTYIVYIYIRFIFCTFVRGADQNSSIKKFTLRIRVRGQCYNGAQAGRRRRYANVVRGYLAHQKLRPPRSLQ